MPSYEPNEEEYEWCIFCANKGIIISPVAATKGPNPKEWRIGVSFMPNYKKINLSPSIYDENIIWQETFKMMKYYYDKYR